MVESNYKPSDDIVWLDKGITSLWSGLSASVLRQTTYSTARFALYDVLARQVQQRTGRQKLSTASTVFCAGAAGGLAGMIGNPTEVVLVRMCADGVKSQGQRYLYPNAISGMIRIGNEEGLKTFTKGLGPNVVRSVLMSKFPLRILGQEWLILYRRLADCRVRHPRAAESNLYVLISL